VPSVQEQQQNLDIDCSVQVGDSVPELSITYVNKTPTINENQQGIGEIKNCGAKEQQSENSEECLSSTVFSSITSSKGQSYDTDNSAPTADNIDPILSSTTRQSNDPALGLSSLIDRSDSNTAIQHCSKDNSFNIDRIDFSNEFRVPSHTNCTSSMRTFTQPQRLTDTCVYNPSVQQPFVPFNCSSQSASDMDYEAGGLELDSLPTDGSHGNMIGNRTFPHDTPNELSSALLAAMDPDHLSAMVENAVTFFPQT
jgi:hypothetical protein